ncbi:hypothetical protein [Nocardia sp. NPDC057440]|uniref:hypothetical protein n=1 Tax=Nocardia sp. NPDC057440 TaxID=3346134 RepID=UPI00367296E6
MPNIKNWPLMVDVLRQIIDHPETWDQTVWVTHCGTKACVAGWAAQLGGYIPITVPSYSGIASPVFTGGFEHRNNFKMPSKESKEGVFKVPVVENGTWPQVNRLHLAAIQDSIDASGAAIEALGIDDDNIIYDGEVQLFSADNEIRDIFAIVAEWAEQDGFELPEDIRKAMEELP